MSNHTLRIKRAASLGALGVLLATSTGLAQSQITDSPPITAVQAGEYTTELGWGHLSISKHTKGTTTFALHTTTGEDICNIHGTVVHSEGIAIDSENGGVCKIQFTKTDRGVDAYADTPVTCRELCGANGGFKGSYLTVSKECNADEVGKTRNTFKNFYVGKNYKLALATILPIMNNCSNILNFYDLGNIRNDVAIAQYKNGLSNECLTTLKYYSTDVNRKDSDIISDWPPNQGDDYLKIIRASRTNIRLCTKSTRK